MWLRYTRNWQRSQDEAIAGCHIHNFAEPTRLQTRNQLRRPSAFHHQITYFKLLIGRDVSRLCLTRTVVVIRVRSIPDLVQRQESNMDQIDVDTRANKVRHHQQSSSVSQLRGEYDFQSPNWCSTVNQCGGIRSLVSIFSVKNHGFGATTGVVP